MPSKSVSRKIEIVTRVLKRLITVAQKEAKLSVGLDVGTTSVKIVALGPQRMSKQPPILASTTLPLKSGNAADVAATVRSAVSSLGMAVRSVHIGLSGQPVIMRMVEMPTMEPAEIKQALPFEAQRYLPFPVKDVVIDGQALGPASKQKVWVLIVACKRDFVQQSIARVREAALDVAVVDVDAVALLNAFISKEESIDDERTCALVNVGGKFSNVVVTRGNIPYLIRDIPWGSKRLIREVAQETHAEEKSLKEAFSGGASDPATRAALKAAVESLVVELQLSFDYFENQLGKPPEEVYISGGASHWEPFREILAEQLTQPVKTWSPQEGLDSVYTVAYGLALRKA